MQSVNRFLWAWFFFSPYHSLFTHHLYKILKEYRKHDRVSYLNSFSLLFHYFIYTPSTAYAPLYPLPSLFLPLSLSSPPACALLEPMGFHCLLPRLSDTSHSKILFSPTWIAASHGYCRINTLGKLQLKISVAVWTKVMANTRSCSQQTTLKTILWVTPWLLVTGSGGDTSSLPFAEFHIALLYGQPRQWS